MPIAPTVLTDVTPDIDVYREELFGPAGVVYKVADEDEAVAIANDTTFGLGSYVYTTDEEQAAAWSTSTSCSPSPELPSVGAAIIADYETSGGRSSIQEALRKRFAGAKPADAVQHSLANLREVSAILDAKAPADASSFKAWLSGHQPESRGRLKGRWFPRYRGCAS